MIAIKQQLYNLCQEFISKRILAARQAIEEAQAAANEETKSSSGDKYETGRAMAQLEIEKNSAQLAEAFNTKRSLEQIKIDKQTDKALPGSLVITDNGNFFISISVGELVVENVTYIAVSAQSPAGARLMGLEVGATFALGSRTYRISQLW